MQAPAKAVLRCLASANPSPAADIAKTDDFPYQEPENTPNTSFWVGYPFHVDLLTKGRIVDPKLKVFAYVPFVCPYPIAWAAMV